MIVSSSGDELGAGVGDCAQIVVARAKIDNRRKNICRISGELVPLQETMHFFGQFWANSFRGGDLLHARFAQAIDRTKFSQEQIFSVLTHAWAIVENTLVDSFLEQEL